jgi:8-oxo-dGTP pyrophosphatase MutT (NUDIX family)
MAAPDWKQIRESLAARPARKLAGAVSNWAAVALILRQGPGDIELLFIERAQRSGDPWSGQIAFPGGRSAPGEDDLLLTARRETREEIGIELAGAAELLGALDPLRARARLRVVDLAIAPFVFRLAQPVEVSLNAEVRRIHWLALARLLEPASQSTSQYPREGGTLTFPCLRCAGIVIWGLTYRIFLDFAARLRGD